MLLFRDLLNPMSLHPLLPYRQMMTLRWKYVSRTLPVQYISKNETKLCLPHQLNIRFDSIASVETVCLSAFHPMLFPYLHGLGGRPPSGFGNENIYTSTCMFTSTSPKFTCTPNLPGFTRSLLHNSVLREESQLVLGSLHHPRIRTSIDIQALNLIHHVRRFLDEEWRGIFCLSFDASATKDPEGMEENHGRGQASLP